MAKPDLVLSQSFPTPVRFVVGMLAAGGAYLLVTELWRGVWPPSVVTPFFLVIVAGGVFACGVALFASAFGSTMTVRLSTRVAEIERFSPLGMTRERLGPGSVAAAYVEVCHWDSSADTWRVVLDLADGRTLKLPDQQRREDADAAAARFLAELG